MEAPITGWRKTSMIKLCKQNLFCAKAGLMAICREDVLVMVYNLWHMAWRFISCWGPTKILTLVIPLCTTSSKLPSLSQVVSVPLGVTNFSVHSRSTIVLHGLHTLPIKTRTSSTLVAVLMCWGAAPGSAVLSVGFWAMSIMISKISRHNSSGSFMGGLDVWLGGVLWFFI